MLNYDEIAALGEKKAEEIMGKLMDRINFMRRQSDVVGRLGAQSYGVLLQRPQYETEPQDALVRFCEILEELYNSFDYDSAAIAPKLELNMVELPQGTLHDMRTVPAAGITAALKENENA